MPMDFLSVPYNFVSVLYSFLFKILVNLVKNSYICILNVIYLFLFILGVSLFLYILNKFFGYFSSFSMNTASNEVSKDDIIVAVRCGAGSGSSDPDDNDFVKKMAKKAKKRLKKAGLELWKSEEYSVAMKEFRQNYRESTYNGKYGPF